MKRYIYNFFPIVLCVVFLCVSYASVATAANTKKKKQKTEKTATPPEQEWEFPNSQWGRNYVVRNEEMLNSNQNDFAPTMIKNVLVFSSNRPLVSTNVNTEVTMNRFNTYFDDFKSGTTLSEYDNLNINDIPARLQNRIRNMEINDMEAALQRRSDLTEESSQLYVTTYNNNRWELPEECPLILNLYAYNGPAHFASNGNTLYVNYINEENIRVLKVSHKVKDEQRWTYPILLLFPDHEPFLQYSMFSHCISSDGRLLIFSSNKPKGVGGYDLYASYLSYPDMRWSNPFNLSAINTPGDEVFPAFDAADNLYFSSTGHAVCVGGLDIYKAIGALGEWTGVENMGPAVNSAGNDYGIMFYPGSSTSGLLASDRRGGYGGDDIYRFEKIHGEAGAFCNVGVRVTSWDTLVFDATVTMASKNITYTGNTSIRGDVFFTLPPATYTLVATKDNCMLTRIIEIPDKTEERYILMDLKPVTVEKKTKKPAKPKKKKSSAAAKS